MSTVPHKLQTGSNKRPDDEQQHREQLARDRRIGVLIFLALLVLAALLIWLSSLGSTSPNGDYLEYYDI